MKHNGCILNLQTYGIPKLLNGSSCVLASETGCGKTLAYLLPVLQQIVETKRSRNFHQGFNEPLAVILVPSRELADQVFVSFYLVPTSLDL